MKTPRWMIRLFKKGHVYGSLYEAFDEEDALNMAKEFLARKLTKYDRVEIYHYGVLHSEQTSPESDHA